VCPRSSSSPYSFVFVISVARRPPTSPLFPSTTLSRSRTPIYKPMRAQIVVGVREFTRAADVFSLILAHLEEKALQAITRDRGTRSEEHTSELQSLTNLVCRLLLENKKTLYVPHRHHSH